MHKKVTYYLEDRKIYIPLHHSNKERKMNQIFIHILLCGIIVLLTIVRGSECYV